MCIAGVFCSTPTPLRVRRAWGSVLANRHQARHVKADWLGWWEVHFLNSRSLRNSRKAAVDDGSSLIARTPSPLLPPSLPLAQSTTGEGKRTRMITGNSLAFGTRRTDRAGIRGGGRGGDHGGSIHEAAERLVTWASGSMPTPPLPLRKPSGFRMKHAMWKSREGWRPWGWRGPPSIL